MEIPNLPPLPPGEPTERILLDEEKGWTVAEKIKNLPDMFGRLPIDFPTTPIPDIGPFSEPNVYEVRCSFGEELIEFYWAGVLVGQRKFFAEWPSRTLPYIYMGDLYYATGNYYRKITNDIEDNTIYCYPVAKVKT